MTKTFVSKNAAVAIKEETDSAIAKEIAPEKNRNSEAQSKIAITTQASAHTQKGLNQSRSMAYLNHSSVVSSATNMSPLRHKPNRKVELGSL